VISAVAGYGRRRAWMVGMFLGAIGMTRILLWQGIWHTYGAHYPLVR
jgi:hypothetical protein